MQVKSTVDDFEKISILLHHVIFSYERAHENLVGTTSKAILQELVKELTKTFELGDLGFISKSKSLQENLQSYIDNLNSSKYFDEVSINKLDGSYIFEVKNCKFAQTNSHIVLAEKKHTCPFAILAAAIIYYSSYENLIIQNTDFDINGGRTVIEQVKNV